MAGNYYSNSAHSTNSFLKPVELVLQLVVSFQHVVSVHQFAELSVDGDFLKSVCSFVVGVSADPDCDDWFSPTAHNCLERTTSAHDSDHYFSNTLEFFVRTMFCNSGRIHDRCGTFDRFGILNRCCIFGQYIESLDTLGQRT